MPYNRGMKRLTVVVAMGMASSVVHASPRATYKFVDPRGVGAPWVQPAPANVSHVIFMDNCKPNGCHLVPGEDGTQNQSDIINNAVTISAYQGTDAQWQALVKCVKDTYAPFNVQIVTAKADAGAHYHHAIVAGMAAEAGMGQGVLGVSPFTCGYIPDAISFTFANEEPTNLYDLCWTVSQETSHSWGLDHKFDDRDPMTYLTSGPQWKQFQNQAGSCGEYSARQCSCTYAGTGSSGENSVALITATFGAATGTTDTTPPTVHITAPASGAAVAPGFTVTASVTDDTAVAKAELRIDNQLVGTVNSSPFTWTAPQTLAAGSHHVEVTGYDTAGNTAKDAVDVTYSAGGGCTHDSDCTSGEVCTNGQCVAGPSMPGGLGSTCSANADCASGQCAMDDQGHSYCVQSCDPSHSTCPSGFGCQTVGASGGVCWPGANSGGGGGGCDAGGGPGLPLGLGIGLAAMLITRRRR